jgi:hypothetical protein
MSFIELAQPVELPKVNEILLCATCNILYVVCGRKIDSLQLMPAPRTKHHIGARISHCSACGPSDGVKIVRPGAASRTERTTASSVPTHQLSVNALRAALKTALDGWEALAKDAAAATTVHASVPTHQLGIGSLANDFVAIHQLRKEFGL